MSQVAQFARIESFGLVASKQAKTKKNKTTILGSCAEAARVEGFTGHVDNVEPADVVFGINPMALYNQIKTGFEAQNIERKESGGRARQKDSLLMSAGVFSYPNAIDDDFYSWQADCITYLKNEYGDKFKSAVVHLDESHPHLHFFLCDLKTLTVDQGLDPAKTDQRKQRVVKDGSHIGQREALQAFQDRFQAAVGVKYNHARKIGSRDRIHGAPRWVRSLLLEIKEIQAEKIQLEEKKDRLKERAETLKEKARSVLLLEKRFSEGLDKVTSFFESQDLKERALITAGRVGEAQAVRKSMESIKTEFLSNPAITETLAQRTKKPAWFRLP
jgi:hypothetical protein